MSDSVGNALTFDLWHVKTGKFIQRSAVRTEDPKCGAIPNLRVKFDEELEDAKEPAQVDPVNILDDPELMCLTKSNIPRHPKPNDERTMKHKTK